MSVFNYAGKQFHSEFIPSLVAQVAPITQAYAIAINEEGLVLIIKQEEWTLPGGTPEKGESPEHALTREVREEASVVVDNLRLLGYSKVQELPSGDPFYQLRYLCDVKQILPSAPDPVTRKTYERRFVSIEELSEYIPWTQEFLHLL